MIIDISSNNGIVNFPALVKSGITDIFIRATLGCTDQDKILQDNAKNAAKAGLAVSYYHVAYPGTKFTGDIKSNAIKQATNLLTSIQGLPKPKWIALDLETQITISDFEFSAWMQTWLDRVQSITDIVPLIYTYQSYLDQHLPAIHKFGSYPLWIANYNGTNTPKLPVGWDKWFLYQYTNKGNLDGIRGNVDISKLNEESTTIIPEQIASTPTLGDKIKNLFKLS